METRHKCSTPINSATVYLVIRLLPWMVDLLVVTCLHCRPLYFTYIQLHFISDRFHKSISLRFHTCFRIIVEEKVLIKWKCLKYSKTWNICNMFSKFFFAWDRWKVKHVWNTSETLNETSTKVDLGLMLTNVRVYLVNFLAPWLTTICPHGRAWTIIGWFRPYITKFPIHSLIGLIYCNHSMVKISLVLKWRCRDLSKLSEEMFK
jgi:hypothetical protein